MKTAPDVERQRTFAALNGSFDVLVIGGGATGLGIAVDAVTRGYKTALVEAGDYAQATSSRSTKLVHGGVRYLASGQIHLVREALHERAVMLRNAPHLVHPLPTILPAQHGWELPWFGAGLSLYDLLSGKSSMGPTRILGRKKTAEAIPGLAMEQLSGSVLYHDAQFNDARFALALARTAIDHGATVLNYARCTRLLYSAEGRINGAVIRDMETGAKATLAAKAVINATGIFTDALRTMDEPERPALLSVSRGTHIVVAARFLGGNKALMVPKTADGRVIFALPWQGSVVIGTTDLAAAESLMEPGYVQDEIEYLLEHIQPYLAARIERSDILSIFSGLRPLVTGKENKTSKLSREHHIDASASGLITVAGGKWTTYRRMAQDTLDYAIREGSLTAARCVTDTVALHGSARAAAATAGTNAFVAEYGSDAAKLAEMIAREPELATRIDAELPYTFAMVAFAVRYELARTVEDVLSRRTRALLLHAAATVRAAPAVAALMARELGCDQAWVETQVTAFTALADEYYVPGGQAEPVMAGAAAGSSNHHQAL